MKALTKLKEVSDRLLPYGIESVKKEAELLIRKGLNVDLVSLYRDNPEVDDSGSSVIDEMVCRRSGREPLQYILGHVYFLDLKLIVGEGVLIPRPETELMAEHAVKQVSGLRLQVSGQKEESSLSILDLCTGSGCLALSLARAFPGCRVIGSDISGSAISYAKKNASVNKLRNADFVCGDLFDPIKKSRLFDLIISNPPYIKADHIKNLQPEIRNWEPLIALEGGSDGLYYYRRIVYAAHDFLKDNGILMLELGDDCAEAVSDMLAESGFSHVEITEDYSGTERIIKARWTR